MQDTEKGSQTCIPLDSQTICIGDVSKKQFGKKDIETLQTED